jgi:hypothetical protein
MTEWSRTVQHTDPGGGRKRKGQEGNLICSNERLDQCFSLSGKLRFQLGNCFNSKVAALIKHDMAWNWLWLNYVICKIKCTLLVLKPPTTTLYYNTLCYWLVGYQDIEEILYDIYAVPFFNPVVKILRLNCVSSAYDNIVVA